MSEELANMKVTLDSQPAADGNGHTDTTHDDGSKELTKDDAGTCRHIFNQFIAQYPDLYNRAYDRIMRKKR